MTNILYPLGDNKGSIELIDVMGNDLEIVNDARVSYDRESDTFTDKDEKLLNYLIKHKHTSPLRGCALKFQVKCPLYIARQWWKHHIASSYSEGQDGWNEKSLRYAKIDEDDFYIPKKLPFQDTENKQGSVYEGAMAEQLEHQLLNYYRVYVSNCISTYNKMIEAGVSREIARGVLPACVYTRFRWTVSLHAFLNFLVLRKGDGAQSEITEYARAAEELAYTYFPKTLWAFFKHTTSK